MKDWGLHRWNINDQFNTNSKKKKYHLSYIWITRLFTTHGNQHETDQFINVYITIPKKSFKYWCWYPYLEGKGLIHNSYQWMLATSSKLTVHWLWKFVTTTRSVRNRIGVPLSSTTQKSKPKRGRKINQTNQIKAKIDKYVVWEITPQRSRENLKLKWSNKNTFKHYSIFTGVWNYSCLRLQDD